MPVRATQITPEIDFSSLDQNAPEDRKTSNSEQRITAILDISWIHENGENEIGNLATIVPLIVPLLIEKPPCRHLQDGFKVPRAGALLYTDYQRITK